MENLEKLIETVRILRSPQGCEWDRAQTHKTLKPNMLEEAYEAVDAIDSGDTENLREELGDVLLQVLLHSQIADDNGEFNLDDVAKELNEKLMELKNKATQEPTTTAPAQQTTQATETPAETTDEFLNNYKGSDNSPVKAKEADLTKLFNNIKGVYDDGKDSQGRGIGDFTTATAKNYDANTGTVTIGKHEYKVISDQANGYLYVEDLNPRGGLENNRQVYIVEYNSRTQKYELHQRTFDEICKGVGKGAH